MSLYCDVKPLPYVLSISTLAVAVSEAKWRGAAVRSNNIYGSSMKFKVKNNIPTFEHFLVAGLLVQVLLFFAASWFLPSFLSTPGVQLIPVPSLPNERIPFDFKSRLNPLLQAGLIRSHPNSPHHDPTKKRRCFAFTAVPKEINKLFEKVEGILKYERYANVLDCIHLVIPDRSTRFGDIHYPTTQQLLDRNVDPRIIITRTSFDYGPMTRYLGPLHFEQHPETSVILFDIDSDQMLHNPDKDLAVLFFAAEHIDTTAMWCFQGENFYVDDQNRVHSAWDTFNATEDPRYKLWYNQCHFCRGVGGLLFKVKHFKDFWWNQTAYHESCFWDDDRWVSFQMERQGILMKVLHAPITKVDNKPGSQEWFDVTGQGIVRDPVMEDVREKEIRVETTSERLNNKRLIEALQHSDGNPQNRLTLRMKTTTTEKQRNALLQFQHLDKVLPNDNTFQSASGESDRADQDAVAHRRLGSLTQITVRLVSDQTCPLAWLSRHPNVYPSARTKRRDPNVLPPPDDLSKLRKSGRLYSGILRRKIAKSI